MGARPDQVIRQFVREGLKLIAISLTVGGAAAFGLTRLMRTLLFGITPTDPQTYIGIAALTTMIALVACYIPARRAAKVDPLTALKQE
jgi:ABC-type antimicrobial peptide transport system permease subunit